MRAHLQNMAPQLSSSFISIALLFAVAFANFGQQAHGMTLFRTRYSFSPTHAHKQSFFFSFLKHIFMFLWQVIWSFVIVMSRTSWLWFLKFSWQVLYLNSVMLVYMALPTGEAWTPNSQHAHLGNFSLLSTSSRTRQWKTKVWHPWPGFTSVEMLFLLTMALILGFIPELDTILLILS